MSSKEKIYRVHAHNTLYPTFSPMYYIARSEEQLRDELMTDYAGTLIIDGIVEVTVEEVVNQLNLHLS